MSLDHLIADLAPTRLEEVMRNRKAVLWRCWHEQRVIGYRVAGLDGSNPRAFTGVGAWEEAQAELSGRARRRRA